MQEELEELMIKYKCSHLLGIWWNILINIIEQKYKYTEHVQINNSYNLLSKHINLFTSNINLHAKTVCKSYICECYACHRTSKNIKKNDSQQMCPNFKCTSGTTTLSGHVKSWDNPPFFAERRPSALGTWSNVPRSWSAPRGIGYCPLPLTVTTRIMNHF